MTHICVGKITTIGSDYSLSPGRRQAIIWTNAGILLIGPWGTNFSEILISIQTVSFKKMHLKMSSAKWRSFGLGLNVLIGLWAPYYTQCNNSGHMLKYGIQWTDFMDSTAAWRNTNPSDKRAWAWTNSHTHYFIWNADNHPCLTWTLVWLKHHSS